ncbi:MAG: hypothetical protein NT157_01535 [Candidatus Micrarchaeota archaeon]|nr:hypothetical protein [Candidatus Micrarchaeota archaeon]
MEEAKPFVKWASGKMKKEKLIVILTEEGTLESCRVSAKASTEDVEQTLCETYSLCAIQWMEIDRVATGTLKTLNERFGKKMAIPPMKA